MAIEISAQKREVQGTGASRRLRHQGMVPAILYGGDKEPVNLVLDHQALILNLRNERFHASILTLDLAGAKEQVLLRSVNMHPYKLQVQHVDFQRVSKDKKIHMKVPLHFANAEKSPGVKEQGGVVSHVVNEIDIVCFPADLPEFIEVDLSNLAVGNSVHARQLALPKGVELSLNKAEDPVIATVVVPQLVTEDEEKVAEAAVVSAADVPTTAQATPAKDGEAGGEGDKGGKGGDKAAAKPAGDKAGDKGDKKDKK